MQMANASTKGDAATAEAMCDVEPQGPATTGESATLHPARGMTFARFAQESISATKLCWWQ